MLGVNVASGAVRGLTFCSPSGSAVLAGRARSLHLRHAAATYLLAQGMTLEDVKQLLGHSLITLTANTYGHALEEPDASALAGSVAGRRRVTLAEAR